jgi:GntR family transcriptional regulator
MTSMDINTKSPIPLYIQLKELLVRQIRRGELHPHDRLPSERELSERYGISRMTVRQALQLLVKEGVLYTAAGKGTYVSEVLFEQDHALTGFTEQMQRASLQAASRVLEATIIPATPYIAGKLEIPAHSGVILLKRLRLANDKPVAIETAYLPQNLCPDLLQHDFSRESLYAVLREDYGLVPASAIQVVEAALANVEEARLLELHPPAAVLRMERVTRTPQNVVIEYVESVYRGDRYKFYAHLRA